MANCLRCEAHTQNKSGYCSKFCYYNRNGDTILDKFWAKVNVTKKCWTWFGSTNYKGYGLFGVKGKNVSTHIFSYRTFVGPIKNGMQVLHTCDTPNCIRPSHLYQGTNQDNCNDKVLRGQQYAKVSLKQAERTRKRYAKGNITQRQLANERPN